MTSGMLIRISGFSYRLNLCRLTRSGLDGPSLIHWRHLGVVSKVLPCTTIKARSQHHVANVIVAKYTLRSSLEMRNLS